MAFAVKVIKANKKVSDRYGEQQTILRVAPYARVSRDTEEQLNSYKSQLAHYTDMVNEKNDWILVDVYADEAITGTQVTKRDDFQRLINDALKGKIDLIITKSISRFARNTVDTLKYVRMLKERNVAVFFEKENINTLTMDGEMLLTILSSVAQQEVENISAIVKMGLKMKMQRGELIGFQSCLGYDYNQATQKISVNEEEASIVRYIFDRYIAGAGAYVIAKELMEKGYRTNRGNTQWHDTTVLGIIKNEKYKGDLLQGKTFTVDPISKRRLDNRGEEDQYYIKNHHEAIISEEIFEKAQDILYRRGSKRQKIGKGHAREKYSRKFAFSSMLECGFCGTNLTRRSWNSGTSHEKAVWQCTLATKKGKKYCPCSKGIDEQIFETAFVETYKMVCDSHKEVLNELLIKMETVFSEQSHQKQLSKVNTEIQALEQKRSRLIDLCLDERIERSTYELKYTELEATLTGLLKEKDDLEEATDGELNVEKRIASFRRILQDNGVLPVFDRNVFESIVDKIIVGERVENEDVNPYKLTIIYKTGFKGSFQAEMGVRAPKKQTVNERGDFCSYSSDNTCGGRNRNATQRYLEILCFQHFSPFTTFAKDGPDFKNKVLKETIEVSVVLEGSNGFTGALIFNIDDYESYIIAGSVVTHAVVKGVGLELNLNGIRKECEAALNTVGEVGAIAKMALAMHTAFLETNNPTTQFVKAMTLLEFLAYPDKYRTFEFVREEITPHIAKDYNDYLRLKEVPSARRANRH